MLLKVFLMSLFLCFNVKSDIISYSLYEMYELSDNVLLIEVLKISPKDSLVKSLKINVFKKFKGELRGNESIHFLSGRTKEQIIINDGDIGFIYLKKNQEVQEVFKFVRLNIEVEDYIKQGIICEQKNGFCESKRVHTLIESLKLSK